MGGLCQKNTAFLKKFLGDIDHYVILFRELDGLRLGIYRYEMRTHTLEPVVRSEFFIDELRKANIATGAKNLNDMQIVTTFYDRVRISGDDFSSSIFEAGNIVGTIILAAAERKITLMAAGINDTVVDQLIGLNDRYERVVFACFF